MLQTTTPQSGRAPAGLHDDSPVAVIGAGIAGSAGSSLTTCAGRDAGKQPGGKLTPAYPSAGAKTAEVQVQGIGSEVPGHACCRLQRLQSPAPAHPQTDAPPPSS
eukprot:gene794-1071_t